MVAWAPVEALREAVRTMPMPTLQTTHGESLLLCKAHFRIVDDAGLHDALGATFSRDRDSYHWFDHERSVRLAGHELVLETMSRERLERGKQLLRELLGTRIAHRIDSLEDPGSAKRASPRPPRGDELPEELQREILGTYLNDHYRAWPDHPLPALGGKTPRKAMRSKRGRAQVEALLKDIENGTLGMPGGDTVDFAAIRRDLGLEREDEVADLQPQEPAAWLAMAEDERAVVVERQHATLASHPTMPNKHLHIAVHVIVENQLAMGDPPETRATLERLMTAGLGRHEAIHAIGSVVAEAIVGMMKANTAADQAAIVRALKKLRADAWRW